MLFSVKIGGPGFGTMTHVFTAESEFDALSQALNGGYLNDGRRVLQIKRY